MIWVWRARRRTARRLASAPTRGVVLQLPCQRRPERLHLVVVTRREAE